jgi:hypothetical protein
MIMTARFKRLDLIRSNIIGRRRVGHAALPFTVKVVVIVSSLPMDDGRTMCVVNDDKVGSLKFDARSQH